MMVNDACIVQRLITTRSTKMVLEVRGATCSDDVMGVMMQSRSWCDDDDDDDDKIKDDDDNNHIRCDTASQHLSRDQDMDRGDQVRMIRYLDDDGDGDDDGGDEYNNVIVMATYID